jgi:hypothetical protein
LILRTLLVSAAVATSLCGCADLKLPERGFVTHAVTSDDAAPVPVNACTAAACPQAPGFCAARGYVAGTAGYQRCLASVEENLRR